MPSNDRTFKIVVVVLGLITVVSGVAAIRLAIRKETSLCSQTLSVKRDTAEFMDSTNYSSLPRSRQLDVEEIYRGLRDLEQRYCK
jgi:hypothetical protein